MWVVFIFLSLIGLVEFVLRFALLCSIGWMLVLSGEVYFEEVFVPYTWRMILELK
jgi:hypothetical protein